MRNDNFSYWRNEFADMPVLNKDGNWEDLETGFLYDDNWNYKDGVSYKSTPEDVKQTNK